MGNSVCSMLRHVWYRGSYGALCDGEEGRSPVLELLPPGPADTKVLEKQKRPGPSSEMKTPRLETHSGGRLPS